MKCSVRAGIFELLRLSSPFEIINGLVRLLRAYAKGRHFGHFTDKRYNMNLHALAETPKKLFFALLIVLTIVVFAYHIHIITFPYPSEYREGAMIQTTNILLKGENPYAIENQPHDTNTYGIFYSVICYSFAKVFGSSLQLHRAVSGVFILLSCLVVFLFARSGKHPLLPSFTITVILYASLLYRVTPLVRPDSLGLFLFLLSLFVPLRYNYSLGSLFISSLLGALAFFTKAFFLLTYPFLGSYLFFFVSKKSGIIYGVLSCIILTFSVLMVDSFSETYIANAFFIHINLAGYHYKHVINQLFFGVKSYAFICILFAFAAISVLLKRWKQLHAYFTDFNLISGLLNSLDVRDLDSPLFRSDIKCTSYYLLCAVTVFCLGVGGHGGAWMSYFYQLVSPFFLLTLLDFAGHAHIPKGYLYLMLAGIVNVSLFYMTILPHYTVRQVQGQWKQIYEMVNRNNSILNSPAITPVLQQQNKRVYDSGQSEYFKQSVLPKKFSFISRYWTHDKKVTQALERSQRELVEAIKNKKYDVIVVTTNYNYTPFGAESLLPRYYDKKSTLVAPMPHTGQKWLLEVWEKKSELIPGNDDKKKMR